MEKFCYRCNDKDTCAAPKYLSCSMFESGQTYTRALLKRSFTITATVHLSRWLHLPVQLLFASIRRTYCVNLCWSRQSVLLMNVANGIPREVCHSRGISTRSFLKST